jgi:hypothetical protein
MKLSKIEIMETQETPIPLERVCKMFSYKLTEWFDLQSHHTFGCPLLLWIFMSLGSRKIIMIKPWTSSLIVVIFSIRNLL